jgi:molecular chaperone DnaK
MYASANAAGGEGGASAGAGAPPKDDVVDAEIVDEDEKK